jgi:hypothetical protein
VLKKIEGRVGRQRQPLILLIIWYAVANVWSQIRLLLFGWKPVSAVRNIARPCPNSTSVNPSLRLEIADELISALRMACLFPWVRRSCVPNSLALYGILRQMGLEPLIRIGAKVAPFEPHMWIELDGWRIDSGADDQSLDAFEPL